MKEYYICKYNLNAMHSVNHDIEKSHGHTFHIELYVERKGTENREYDVSDDIDTVDVLVNAYLKQYEGNNLTTMKPFVGMGTTIEEIGECFFEAIGELLQETPFELFQLNISENPLFVYQVTKKIYLPIINMENTISNYEVIRRQQDLLRS